MNTTARVVAFLGALLALSAVMLAAMGSHLFDMKGMHGIWQIASVIHLFNAAALMGLAALMAHLNSPLLTWGAGLVILGTIFFCGNIYLHVISGYTLPSVTPAGGMVMMAGWLLAALAFLRKP